MSGLRQSRLQVENFLLHLNMKKTALITSNILAYGFVIITYILWVIKWYSWMGLIGIGLSFTLTPFVLFFPFIVWIVDKIFPVYYFASWSISIFFAALHAILNHYFSKLDSK